MTSATLYLPGIHELQTLLRELPVRIHARRMILQGHVLAAEGEWVAIDEVLAKRRELEQHLEQGEVFYRGRWIPQEEALAHEQAAAAKAATKAAPAGRTKPHSPRAPETPAAPVTRTRADTVRPAPAPQTPLPKAPVRPAREPLTPPPSHHKPPEPSAPGYHDGYAVEAHSVSIGDSVRNVIAFYGPCSLRKLRKHLREQRFGAIKIGLLRLYFTLRNENLESYHKRVRYYRAC